MVTYVCDELDVPLNLDQRYILFLITVTLTATVTQFFTFISFDFFLCFAKTLFSYFNPRQDCRGLDDLFSEQKLADLGKHPCKLRVCRTEVASSLDYTFLLVFLLSEGLKHLFEISDDGF